MSRRACAALCVLSALSAAVAQQPYQYPYPATQYPIYTRAAQQDYPTQYTRAAQDYNPQFTSRPPDYAAQQYNRPQSDYPAQQFASRAPEYSAQQYTSSRTGPDFASPYSRPPAPPAPQALQAPAQQQVPVTVPLDAAAYFGIPPNVKLDPRPQQQQQAVAAATPGPQPQAAQVTPNEPETWEKRVDNLISRGVMKLSLSLADTVATDGDLAHQTANVVFSPVNVAAALALVLAGSNGVTFKEIATVLGIADKVDLTDREKVHKEFGRFLGQLESQSTLVRAGNASNGGNQVVMANGLFVQREFEIQPTFAKIAEAYRSQVIPVEFLREPARTKDLINGWFSEHTMGRIRSVLAEAPPTDTRLMIASALFFNGAWETPFPIEATMTRAFYGVSANGSREAAAVRMMTNNMDLPLAVDRTLGCRLLELPYRGRDVSMYLVLPDAQGLPALRELERKLANDSSLLAALIKAKKDAPVIYSVPRMKLQRSISLRAALEALGVRSMFNQREADLSFLSDSTLVERVPDHSAPLPHQQPQQQPQQQHPQQQQPQQQQPQQQQPQQRPQQQPSPALPAAAEVTPAMAAPSATTPRTAKPTSPAKRPGGQASVPADNNMNSLYFASRFGGSDTALANSTATVPASGDVIERLSGAQHPQHGQHYPARLYADDVLHKVEVEVTETGTVASAATAITISRDGSNHVMRFNRPFIFFIQHNPTGLLLFYGTVVRPMPEWIVPGVDVSQLPYVKPGPGSRPAVAGQARRPGPVAPGASGSIPGPAGRPRQQQPLPQQAAQGPIQGPVQGPAPAASPARAIAG